MHYVTDNSSMVDFNHDMVTAFLQTEPLNTGEWQSRDITDNSMMATREQLHVAIKFSIPETQEVLADLVEPNLPWAEDHFQERVSGEPLNPPPSEAWWPFAQQGNLEAKSQGEAFSHTYPERMWPKKAGGIPHSQDWQGHFGIRFPYGDLLDVVNLLDKSLYTRQAYLPIWFPEDTGTVHGERVPCTLGYHFIVRGNKLDITYYIRSCDYMRHFHDDVYMAARLAQWMVHELNARNERKANTDRPMISPRHLIMAITSFHVFNGDVDNLKLKQKQLHDQSRKNYNERLLRGL